ncbi:MAG: hypothetical protein KDA69_02345 [Planctomycetaceae bacterium]|nr:hypothetical protein [Planctomycetaceae bacterium]
MASAVRQQTSSSESVPTRDELLIRARDWESLLLEGPVTYFPIRHHSPACSLHLERWIDEVRPETIIVEGPRSYDKWIASLLSEECAGPVAILATYRESDELMATRHSAFFPLCDYSPEWVAIRQGKSIGARLRFADMEFADKVRFQQHARAEEEQPGTTLGLLLGDESHLRYSQFINELVRRMGCRDFDELWDHLFESRAEEMTTGEFVGTLATYCDLSRASHEPEQLESDATHAREAIMAEVIQGELKRLKSKGRRGSILVVTGGFHTVALPFLVNAKQTAIPAELPELDPNLTGSWLIRYSYDQLDALAGYRSGMPNPGFYDALWQAGRELTSIADKQSAIARLITTVARQTRGQTIAHEASVSDSIAAVQMLQQLAALRNHAIPTRNDLLDAVTSCMSKESSAGNDLLASIVKRVLAGDRIGSIPSSAGQPPIIDDFHRQATRFRLPVDTIERRKTSLELYRKPEHRPVSFFLHQLELLEVSYATCVDGPDFINGHQLGKLYEEWSVGWTPSAEARLAELGALGETVAGAATQRVVQLVNLFEEQGTSRNADAAVDLLIRVCRCGLHSYARQIVEVVREHIAEDGTFVSVASGLSRLELLRNAREPLEATRLVELPDLITQCYRRATHLMDGLANVPDDLVDGSLDGLLSIREMLASQNGEVSKENDRLRLDEDLYCDSLERLISNSATPARSEIAGAAAGLLHNLGRIGEDRVCEIVERCLDAAVLEVDRVCGVLRGLMKVAREVFWNMDHLLQRIDALFLQWEESRFNNALPHMRLAFSELSPKEVDLVAGRVAGLHDVDSIGVLTHPDVTEEEMQLIVRATELLNRSLAEDGLK